MSKALDICDKSIDQNFSHNLESFY